MSIAFLYFLLVLVISCSSSFSSSMRRRSQSSRSMLDNAVAEQVFVIAGNFSLDGEMLNFAQYDMLSDTWIMKYQAELSSVEYHGVILDVVLNRSANAKQDKLFVVGTFDTMTSTSQMQFCSVGSWNGLFFEKVGEGLCPRGNNADSMTTKILAIALGSDGDLFVGGIFESRVWDGHKFINIQYLARYNGASSSWLPLADGSLTCIQAAQFPSVQALSWDPINETLYIGGSFDSIEMIPKTIGLAMWSKRTGLVSFPTPGAYVDDGGQAGGSVSNVQYESRSNSLFVTGNFRWIGGIRCITIAVWNRLTNEWRCLYQPIRGISTITALLLHNQRLYVAGWTATTSDWNGRQWQSNYAVAELDIAGYIAELQISTSKKAFATASAKASSFISRRRHHDLNSEHSNESLASTDQEIEFTFGRPPHSSSPSTAPTAMPVAPWSPQWQWLSGYPGGNGPIVKLVPGSGNLEGCMFIVGAFNDNQAVLIWCNDTVDGPTLSPFSPRHSIQGLITSITQLSVASVNVPTFSPVHSPTNDVVVLDRNHAAFMFASFAVLIASIIGLVIVIRQRQGYSRLSGNDDEESRKSHPSQGDMTFPLTNLSGGMDSTVDFRASFERAMQARHLPSHESLLIIDPSEVKLLKAIGEGSFGRVWSGYWRNNAVAIKEFIFAQSAIVGGSVDRNNIIDEIVGEAGIMACLRHPKILQVYGCSLTMQAIWIASELCNRGSLRMVLNDLTVDLPYLKKLSLCLDVADGMLYLHTRNPPIIHRDLKSHNIFIIENTPGNFVAKIGDWGSARALALSGAKSMTQGVGTACWLAPEVINNAHFSKDSDVFAFGILLWEVYTRLEVHERLSAAQIIAKVAHEGLRPPLPRNCPWTELMTACWAQNPRMRPGFNKILTELSAMYSSAKANARLQMLTETHRLHVNPTTFPDGHDRQRSRTRSSPTLPSTPPPLKFGTNEENEVSAINRHVVLESAVGRGHANSTPVPMLSKIHSYTAATAGSAASSITKDLKEKAEFKPLERKRDSDDDKLVLGASDDDLPTLTIAGVEGALIPDSPEQSS